MRASETMRRRQRNSLKKRRRRHHRILSCDNLYRPLHTIRREQRVPVAIHQQERTRGNPRCRLRVIHTVGIVHGIGRRIIGQRHACRSEMVGFRSHPVSRRTHAHALVNRSQLPCAKSPHRKTQDTDARAIHLRQAAQITDARAVVPQDCLRPRLAIGLQMMLIIRRLLLLKLLVQHLARRCISICQAICATHTFAPVARVYYQHDISRPRQRVADKHTVVEPMHPLGCVCTAHREQKTILLSTMQRIDHFLFADSKMRSMVMEEQNRRADSASLRAASIRQQQIPVRCISVAHRHIHSRYAIPVPLLCRHAAKTQA